MKEYLEDFLSDNIAREMRDFFVNLKDETWDVMILVTRKGFWIYSLLEHEYVELRMENRAIYSDRYLMKASSNEFIKGKTVWLVDDTMTRGYSMFRYFCILMKEGASKVIPAVYALSMEFPLNDTKKQMQNIYFEVNEIDWHNRTEQNQQDAQKMYDEFMRNIYNYRYLTQENISHLCIRETELFQQALCPLVVDLPMMTNKKLDGSVLSDSFVLTQDKFSGLCKEIGEWRYVPNRYEKKGVVSGANGIGGILQETIQCNYFEYHAEWVERLQNSFVQNAVVKCKYNEESNGTYRVVFVPFVIARSCSKEDLWNAFCLLMRGTDYQNLLSEKKSLGQELTKYDWIGVYRAVIFALSLYVGEEFRKHLCKVGIAASGYDWKLAEKNSDKMFLDSVKQAVLNEDVLSRLTFTSSGVKQMQGEDDFSLEKAYITVRNAITSNDKGRNDNSNNNSDAGNDRDSYSMEELEETLLSKYCFWNRQYATGAITSIILIMLEISVCSNYLIITDDRVIRSFRHGENSGLLLAKPEILNHLCKDVLYITYGENMYKYYNKHFMSEVKEKMYKAGIFEEISEDCFSIDDDENGRDDNISEGLYVKMLGRRFLIRNMDKTEQKVRNIAMDVAENL